MTFKVTETPVSGYHKTNPWKEKNSATVFFALLVQPHTMMMSLHKFPPECRHMILYTAHNTGFTVCVCVCMRALHSSYSTFTRMQDEVCSLNLGYKFKAPKQ